MISRLQTAGRAVAAALGLLAAGFAAAGPSVYPDGTTRLDPARAWPSFVLFTGGDETARLIDLDGRTVHTWHDVGGFASLLIDPALARGQRGHVLVTLENASGRGVDLVVPQHAHQRRAPAAQRQHLHRRRPERPPVPGHARRRRRVGVRERLPARRQGSRQRQGHSQSPAVPRTAGAAGLGARGNAACGDRAARGRALIQRFAPASRLTTATMRSISSQVL